MAWVFNPFTGKLDWTNSSGVTDHGLLTGLSDDDHTQYALLLGRSGGQTLIGGTASGNNLTLQSTSNVTKGNILFGTSVYDEVNNRLGIGTTNPGGYTDAKFTVRMNTATHNGNSIAYLASFNRVNSDVATWYMGADTSDNGVLVTNNADLRIGKDFVGTFYEYMRMTIINGVATTAQFAFNSNQLILLSTGNVGIGINSPTAKLHLVAGTATASTAPLKFNSGTSLTTAEAGAVEFTTDDLFFTITTGAARKAFVLDDGTRLTSGKTPVATTNGRLVDGLVLAASTYTPTRSAESNLDSNVTMSEAQYMRVGNTVTVSGRFIADPTTTSTATSFEITLPIASNIGAVEDVAGVAFCGSIAGQGAEIIGVVANDTAKIQWIAVDTTSQTWSYQFSYQII